jgi:hypothetical protein
VVKVEVAGIQVTLGIPNWVEGAIVCGREGGVNWDRLQ